MDIDGKRLPPGEKTSARSYADSDLKLLFSRSAGLCAFPGCTERCMKEGNSLDEPVIFGKVAHIVAHSPSGPRGNSGLTSADRKKYANLILLCGNHHDIVDGQPATYPIETLKEWKSTLEAKVEAQLKRFVIETTFAELDEVTGAILLSPTSPATDFAVTPPLEKMQKNALSAQIGGHMKLALGKAKEVAAFVQQKEATSPTFSESLKAGLKYKYELFKGQGLRGDNLFNELVLYASRGSYDLKAQAAGLAVLGYFFESCEVFEK